VVTFSVRTIELGVQATEKEQSSLTALKKFVPRAGNEATALLASQTYCFFRSKFLASE
jgi:hypothetical protein